MSTGKMHADEVHTDVSLVARLIAAQFPQWADLLIERVESAGTDNAIYRLGDGMCVRLPRINGSSKIEKEHEWLPRLAPHLPLSIPTPIAMGTPAEGYPWEWSVYDWLDGEIATLDRIADPLEAATDLARFVSALHRIDAVGGPGPGEHNGGRGEPLGDRDNEVREAITALQGTFAAAAAATAAWESALEAPAWDGPAVWVHGDLLSANLLATGGHLSAVIDFGSLGIGDPACDVMAAWSYLPAQARNTFREGLVVDDATWARARGWALSWGLIALPYYRVTDPVLAGIARQAIDAVLGDLEQGG